MKKLLLLLLLAPIISFAQNEEELDPEYQEEVYQEEEIPKYENPIEYKGLIKTETKNDTLIVYSYNLEYELSRGNINSNSEVRCSGENFFVVQDNTIRSVIIYDQLCNEIGRVKLLDRENLAILFWDADDYFDSEFDFKIIDREINMTKFYSKNGQYKYKREIDENEDFDN